MDCQWLNCRCNTKINKYYRKCTLACHGVGHGSCCSMWVTCELMSTSVNHMHRCLLCSSYKESDQDQKNWKWHSWAIYMCPVCELISPTCTCAVGIPTHLLPSVPRYSTYQSLLPSSPPTPTSVSSLSSSTVAIETISAVYVLGMRSWFLHGMRFCFKPGGW